MIQHFYPCTCAVCGRTLRKDNSVHELMIGFSIRRVCSDCYVKAYNNTNLGKILSNRKKNLGGDM